MSEVELLRLKIEELEKKIATLEETIATIERMEKSERITDYLTSRKRIHNLISLINSLSDEQFSTVGEINKNDFLIIEKEQNDLEERIQESIYKTNEITIYELRNEAFFGVSECEEGLVITNYFGFDLKIIIPPFLYDKKVIKIGKKAFENSNCESIVLPDSIIEIEDEAFKNCKSLFEIKLSMNLQKIGRWAFFWCKSLKSITLPETLNCLGTECFVNSGIEQVVIPGSLHTVPSGCFMNCNLKKVILKEGISVIDKSAFCSFNNNGLKEIVFPKSIELVDTEMINYQTKIVFLGNKAKWIFSSISRKRLNGYVVYCSLGSEILKSSILFGFEVHPISEYFDDK